MPRHLACGLSVFLAAAACDVMAQKAEIPLPEKGKVGEYRTLLYIVPDDVEVRVERHWLTDNDLFVEASISGSLLHDKTQQLSVEMQQELHGFGRLYMQLDHDTDTMRGQAGFSTTVADRLQMSATVWHETDTHERRQGVAFSSRMRLGAYGRAGVRLTDSGSCRHGCAELNVSVPL